MLEKAFQASLIKDIKKEFPKSIVLKNDPNYIQGFPDLLVLYKDKWAALECKQKDNSHKQPNQDYYINILGKMSYASFINPKNKEEVINELHQAFGTRRNARVSTRK